MKHKWARAFRWILTAAIVVFLIIFARTIKWGIAWDAISHASWPLVIAALLVNFVSIAIKGIRWWLFLRAAGAPSFGLAMRATLAGAGLNNVLVANGGEAARVVFVSRASGVPSSTILATLALERLFDAVGFVMLLVYGTIVFELPPVLERWRRPAEVLLVLIAIFLVWFVYNAKNIKPEHVPERRAKARTFWGKVRRYLSGFAESTRTLTTGWRFTGAFLLSMASWALQFATFALAAAAAHVKMPLGASFAGLLAINLGLLIRATPGNVGFFQFMYAIAVEEFGISRDSAIAISLLIQTLQIIPITLIGVALAPEFIFKKRAKRDVEVTDEHEQILLRDASQKGEKLSGTAG